MYKIVVINGKGVKVDLTQEEIDARLAEETAAAERKAALAVEITKTDALKAKWPTTDALLDDIITRGVAAVKRDRDAILNGEV